MNRNILLTFLMFSCLFCYGQYLTNPSFEAQTGSYGGSFSIPGWSICAGSPDIQPGYWCIKLSPSNGNSYLGLASLNGTTSFGGEAVGQYLQDSLKKGMTYTFSADIADSDSIYGQNNDDLPPPKPCAVPISLQGSILKVYASTLKRCGPSSGGKPTSGTLIWHSDTVRTTNWKTYSGTFVPDSNYRYIRLEVISRNVRSVNGLPLGGNLVYLKIDNLKLYAGTVTGLINSDQNSQAYTSSPSGLFDRLRKWVRLVFN